MAQRIKMPLEIRAKQFIPYAALTGFEEALEVKEKEHENKFTLNLKKRKNKEIIKLLKENINNDTHYIEVIYDDNTSIRIIREEIKDFIFKDDNLNFLFV